MLQISRANKKWVKSKKRKWEKAKENQKYKQQIQIICVNLCSGGKLAKKTRGCTLWKCHANKQKFLWNYISKCGRQGGAWQWQWQSEGKETVATRYFIFYFTFICVFYFFYFHHIFYIAARVYIPYIYIVYFYLPRRASVNQVKGQGCGSGRGVQENFFSLGNSQLEKVGDALPLLLTAFVWSVERRSRWGRGSKKKRRRGAAQGRRRQIAASMFVMQTNFI